MASYYFIKILIFFHKNIERSNQKEKKKDLIKVWVGFLFMGQTLNDDYSQLAV